MSFRVFLLGTLLALLPARAQLEAVTAAREYRIVNGSAILARFADLLRIPNVASDTSNIRRNAHYIAEMLERHGAVMELLELEPDVPPIVTGRLQSDRAVRTIGIYVHYDGQPVSEELWTTSPWEPTLASGALEAGGRIIPFPDQGDLIDPEWRIYGRAAGDDKAPLATLDVALAALSEAGIARTSNLIFLFEGEEEAGSPNLGRYLRTYRDRFADAEVWLICDGPVHQSRKPQLVFGVRGVTGMEITVYGAARNLHSGHYGNWAPNPALMLSQLLAGMKDAEGNVIVDGFYDTVAPLSDADRAALATVPEVDEALRLELGLACTEGTGNLQERLLLPSLNIRGLASAEVGERARNVIPNEAVAALDIRLVKGNDPDDMINRVIRHIRRQGFHVVDSDPDLETRRRYARIAKVTRGGGYVAARTSLDEPIVAPLVRAAEAAAGEPVVLMPSLGGSLPLYLFNEILDRPLVVVPMANHDDNQHAPDENLRLANLWYGIDLMAAILTMP